MKIFLLFTFISTLHLALSQNDCLPTRCGPTGPIIRFPFRLTDRQPAHCGYPGFELSCTKNGITKLNLQFPVTASTNNTNITIPLHTTVSVWDIDYKAQKMLASNAKAISCLPEKNNLITTLNSSNSPTFEVEALGYGEGYTLFNCSDTRGYNGDQKITCLSSRGYEVIAFASVYEITSLPPYSSCFKMYNISYVPDSMFSAERDGDEYRERFYLRWHEPSCGALCEEQGKYCRLRNGGGEEIECFSYVQPQHNTGASSRNHKPLTAGIITAGTVILLFITIAPCFILRSMKRKQEDRKSIENILENHKGKMRAKRYSYAEIKKITSDFKDAMYDGTLHEGMLADETHVVVKTIDGSEQSVEDFISEVEIIGRMQHANVLPLIGYCVDRRKRALIYEFLQNRTLENFMSSDDRSQHRIALGVAKGISYVQQEWAEKILNLDNISPRNILLDDIFDPKILLFPTDVAAHSFASTYDVVSKKMDVFSFGMLLLEVLGRRRNLFDGREKEKHEVCFPEWIYNEMRREGEENDIFKKLSIVGLWCIQWFPSDRPSMERVVEMLEGDNMPIMPPNPFDLNTQK